jgi:LmbE family N-acetylglucosaminyl deacetylase
MEGYMNYLVVVAHPDDEVLGVGASIYKLAREGNQVDVCILSGEVTARKARPELEDLIKNTNSAAKLLGIHHIIRGSFPNIQFNTVPHLSLVQFIEEAIINTKAEIVFTHHPFDLNNDHYHTSIACQAAIRLFQRRPELTPVRELLFIETPSATEWGLNSALRQFSPNVFIEVGEEGIHKKIEALEQYRGVMRDYPHPRSIEAIKGLAAYRGGQAGLCYAEAFESVFRREDLRRG